MERLFSYSCLSEPTILCLPRYVWGICHIRKNRIYQKQVKIIPNIKYFQFKPFVFLGEPMTFFHVVPSFLKFLNDFFSWTQNLWNMTNIICTKERWVFKFDLNSLFKTLKNGSNNYFQNMLQIQVLLFYTVWEGICQSA